MDIVSKYSKLIEDIKKLKQNMENNESSENVAAIKGLLERCDKLFEESKGKIDLMMVDMEAFSMITEMFAASFPQST